MEVTEAMQETKTKRELISVCGPISPKELGFCQSHEHLALSKGRSWEINPDLCIDDTDKSILEACLYREAGGSAILEAQPGGCNRMTEELVRISEKSKVHILASTGFHKLCFYYGDHWIFSRSQDELADFFIRELTEGMFTDADTIFAGKQIRAKAGFVKTALDSCNLTPDYRRLFLAAADAAIFAGRSVMIHVEKDSDPLKLLDLLTRSGIAPTRLIFCHTDRACPNLDIPLELLRAGAFLELDTIGRFKYHDDLTEASIFQNLVEKGYEDQLLFSLDTTQARLRSYTPNAVGLDYLLLVFLEQLRGFGITSEQISKFSHENVLRALL